MSSVGVNAECLLLSASKRTLDTYVAELANHVPDVVKSVVNTGEFKRNEVFRDALLSFVSFQSVFWREHPSVGCLPGISNYLVLGYINGVQIWRLQPPSAPVLCRPHTERVVGFRTAYPVTTVQLLPDLPGYSSQPSCRLAVVQHKDGCNAVDIFSGSVSGNVHVLQQPWPILCLSASVSWGGGRNGSQYGRWIGTLVVATTQQIRIYDTNSFEIRFTISDFQSISLPPLWRWLSSDHLEPLIQFTHQDAEDPPKARSSGPIFVVGSRWFVYQSTPSGSQNLYAISEPTSEHEMERSYEVPDWKRTAWNRLLSSHSVSRFSNSKLPKALDLLLDQSGIGALFPVVDRHLCSDISTNEQKSVNVQPIGGPLVIVDLITGDVVGHVKIGTGVKSSGPVSSGDHVSEMNSGRVDGLLGDLPISEVQDGAWWLSHLENNIDDDGKAGVTDQLSPESVPVMSHLSFDSSGTTLFCSEWTGRTTWVCRLLTVRNNEGYDTPMVVSGMSIYELWRGWTVGSVIDVASSNNLSGASVVVVASSRGSGHCFSLPSGFHQSQFNSDCSSLLFPTPLRSALPRPSRELNKRDHAGPLSTSFSDSDEENERITQSDPRPSSVEITPPRLSLRPSELSVHKGQKPHCRRSVCRINLLSSTKPEDASFHWKVSFLPSPFFHPSRRPNRSSSWRFRRDLNWFRFDEKMKEEEEEEEEIFILPFLIASSDGVVDFCHAQFTGSGVRSEIEHEQPQIFPELPSLVRSSSEMCIISEDDKPISINTTPNHDPVFSSPWIPLYGGSPNLQFVNVSIAHSLSTRDLKITNNDDTSNSSNPRTTKPTTTGFTWARHCEAITAPHRQLIFTVRSISSFNSNSELNVLFRSGSFINQLFSKTPDKSCRLRSAIDAALNAPIPSPPSHKLTIETTPAARDRTRHRSDDYVMYKF